jgi:hypothetical protein
MPPPRRQQLTSSRVVFSVTLLWTAVSTWTLISMQSSLPTQHSGSLSPLGLVSKTIEEQQREGARSLEATDNAFLQSPLISGLPVPTTSFIYPLHAHSGTHHAYLFVGSPNPQRQTLIVDTGSRLTAFPCQPHCLDCGTHASEQFHLHKSSSHVVLPCSSCLLSKFSVDNMFVTENGLGDGHRGSKQQLPYSCFNNKCQIEQSYTEGSSWRAFEVKDMVWLGTDDTNTSVKEHELHAIPFVFGCQVSEEGLFRKQYAE